MSLMSDVDYLPWSSESPTVPHGPWAIMVPTALVIVSFCHDLLKLAAVCIEKHLSIAVADYRRDYGLEVVLVTL